MKKIGIPRKSFARQMIRLNGWVREDAIREIAHMDKVDETEAARRYDTAVQQMINRMVGQSRRRDKAKMAIDDARMFAISIAFHKGAFLCSRDLSDISYKAGWGVSIGFDSTGRAMREIIEPLEKDGLFSELRDADDKFIGYILTPAGQKEFLAGNE